ncbi:hypothetical protein [Kaistia granuli]|uniref:hypothetical protein n=1 Tax=Kaistia granuli TaxID=363259 RepID=UPI0003750B52|nr:hypothetical protein [Kaistia granuli]
MTDYYAVLKKAVSGFESESGDARRSVYDKARTALIAQLKSIDPPLTTSEISRQRLELEEAIRKVEREASVARATPVRVSAAAAVAEALAASPEPDYAETLDHDLEEGEREEATPPPPPQPTPPPVQRQIEPVRPAPVPAPIPRTVAPAPKPTPPPAPVEDELPDELSYPVEPEAEWSEPEHEIEPPQPVRQPPPIQPQWPQVSPKAEFSNDRQGAQGGRREPTLSAAPLDEPRFDLDDDIDHGRRSADADWAPEPFLDPPTDAGFDEPRGRGGRNGNRGRERDRDRTAERAPAYAERSKPSRWPTLILLILIGLLLGGIAALAWSQRSVVKDVIGDLISSAEQSGGKPTLSENSEPAPASTKNADRLGGEPVVDAPKTVRTVEAEPSPDDQEVDPLAGVMAPEGTRPAAEPAAPEPPAAAPQPAASSGAATADDSLVAQKAILYEQPTDGSQNVKVVNATATWKFNANSSNGPEIQAQLEVPEKGMKVTLNIRKNNDSALPASHLVEIVVDTPADFAGGGVKSVPALVMKPTEESRGQPLDGAAAKVADGFFWIAFSNDAQPMAQNVALLRERNWIDLPLVYNNDQRAILTFEKGTPGQRVFDKAMAAWGSN